MYISNRKRKKMIRTKLKDDDVFYIHMDKLLNNVIDEFKEYMKNNLSYDNRNNINLNKILFERRGMSLQLTFSRNYLLKHPNVLLTFFIKDIVNDSTKYNFVATSRYYLGFAGLWAHYLKRPWTDIYTAHLDKICCERERMIDVGLTQICFVYIYDELISIIEKYRNENRNPKLNLHIDF